MAQATRNSLYPFQLTRGVYHTYTSINVGSCHDIIKLSSYRKLLITTAPTGKGQRVEVTGTDVEGFPFSYLKKVTRGCG